MTDPVIGAITAELKRVEEDSQHSAASQFALAQQFRSVELVAGIPSTALAAVAGVAALADTTNRVAAGVIALVAAGLGAVVVFVGAASQSARASSAGNTYLAIAADARRARQIDLLLLTTAESRELLASLTARAQKQNLAAQPPNMLARWAGKRSVERGDRVHAVDSRPEVQ